MDSAERSERVREHVMFSSRNDPPINSLLYFALVCIDGKAVTRERVAPFAPMTPGALVIAGTHEFKAMVSPHARSPNHRPTEVTFTAKVESTKVYYLVENEGLPVLIEARTGQR